MNLSDDGRATPQLTVSGNLRYHSAQYISVPSSGPNKVEKAG